MSTESAAQHQWPEEEIRARVRQLGNWFHNLRLGGVETAPDHFLGDYPAFKWRSFEQCLPRDLRGRTVLDVGCNAGFYSLELKKRGADRVVAIDTDEGYLAQGRFAAQVLGLAIEFRRLSVYDIARLDEKFDIVLFMGVLYHLRHPLLALDLLHECVVGDLLVFQSLLRGSMHAGPLANDYPFTETAIFDQPDYPKLHFVENCYTGDPTNWWIPNAACAEAMLRGAGFEIVQHPEPEVFLCRRGAMPLWSRRESGGLLQQLLRAGGRRR